MLLLLLLLNNLLRPYLGTLQQLRGLALLKDDPLLRLLDLIILRGGLIRHDAGLDLLNGVLLGLLLRNEILGLLGDVVVLGRLGRVWLLMHENLLGGVKNHLLLIRHLAR